MDAKWPSRLAIVTDWRRADEGGLGDIEAWCGSVANPIMIIVDTLEKFRPSQSGKANSYSCDYEALTGLQKLAGERRLAVVINHHLRKMDDDDPFDTVSGTLGLTGAADTIIVLKRHGGNVTLHVRGRDVEDLETAIQFDRGTCRWKILGAASEVYVSGERAAVLSVLSGAGEEGLTVTEIMAATGRDSRGAMDKLLFMMARAGEVVRVERGIYALMADAGKIGKKERYDNQTIDNVEIKTDLTDLTGPSNLTDTSAVCAHCGVPGDLVECGSDGVVARLHRDCIDAWQASLVPSDLTIPPYLDRRGELSTKEAQS
jgi:hypothetical protein